MMPEPALTLKECAAELQVSFGVILAHIRAGDLVALCLGRNSDPRSRAPKIYRIEREEWERFKKSRRLRPIMAPVEPEEPKPIRKGRPPNGVERTDYGLLGNWRARNTN